MVSKQHGDLTSFVSSFLSKSPFSLRYLNIYGLWIRSRQVVSSLASRHTYCCLKLFPAMDWMYKAPEPSKEEYLLGRKVDKFIEDETSLDPPDERTAIFNERIQANIEMDMATKRREDPLFQIRQREEDARKKLVQNPVKMKQLQQLIAQKDKEKGKKKKKRKHYSDSGDELMEKYLAVLSKKHKIKSEDYDPNSDRSSKQVVLKKQLHDSEDSDSVKKRHKSKDKKHKNNKRNVDNDSDEVAEKSSISMKHYGLQSRKRKSPEKSHKSNKSHSPKHRPFSRSPTASKQPNPKPLPRQIARNMTSDEKAKKLEEMMDNAKWREGERSKNVKRYKAEEKREEELVKSASGKGFLNDVMVDHVTNSSVEDRIRRNKHNVQRRAVDLDKKFTSR